VRIAVVYAMRPAWPKMEWVAEAFSKLGHAWQARGLGAVDLRPDGDGARPAPG